jgi:hypothetical protein
MIRSRPSTGRSRLVVDRWPRLAAAAAASLAVGSLIVRRVARSAGQAANVTAGSEAEPSEPVTPSSHLLSQAGSRMRLAGTAAGGRLSAAGRAAWRELVHADHGPRGGPGAAGAEIPAAPTSSADAPEPRGNPDHSLDAP